MASLLAENIQQHSDGLLSIPPGMTTDRGSSRVANFAQKVRIFFERANYTVKSVDNPDELLQVLTLRQDVFRREFSGNALSTASDFDELDLIADHLVVVDGSTNNVIGNYRLISSIHSNRYYSQEEFCISQFLESGDGKLELSRSCVHPDYRNGIVMQLLWRGVIEYMVAIKARYLFGCTSVSTIQRDSIRTLSSYLEERGAFTDKFGVTPRSNCCFDYESGGSSNPIQIPVEAIMPPIMRAYLRAGAKLYRAAAIDMTFRCTDFFTIMDLENIPAIFLRKYLQ